ncbi:MAG: acetate--CoA ligase family protein [Candidatus Dormibacteria bacterium]
MNVDRSLLHPESVCIVGASANPRRISGRPLGYLLKHSFAGEVFLVNPKYDVVNELPCYHSVTDLPVAVDVALLAIPAGAVPDAILECGRRGIPNAVVVSSGFEDDPCSFQLTQRLREAIRLSGTRVVGPNSEGIWSIPERLTLTFGSVANRSHLIEGPVSVISQSGSIGGACMRELQDRGVGCRYFISTGNETDLKALDFLEFILSEGTTGVVTLFVEAFTDGVRLRDLSARALQAGVRLIVLRAGASELGRAATASHTGRMASTSAVYGDMLRSANVLEVQTFRELIDATQAVVRAKEHTPLYFTTHSQGEGVGIMAISGGSRALLVDACERHGVPIATFTESTRGRLEQLLPRFGNSLNPADITGQVLDDPGLFEEVVSVVAGDEMTRALLIQYANGAEDQLKRHRPFLERLAKGRQQPLVVSLLGAVADQLVQELRTQGVHCATDPDDAVKHLGWLYQLGRARVTHASADCTGHATDPPRLDGWLARMQFLDQLGIGVAQWRIVGNGGEARVAAAAIGFPVVVKALPEDAEHKTDLGLVRVDVRNVQELSAAVRHIRTRTRGSRVLVQEMIQDGVEVVTAARWDADFGPVLAIGAGGALTEWLRDVVYLPLPTTSSEIQQAIRNLKVFTLLQGYRGKPPSDLTSLGDVISRLAGGYCQYAGRGWELEINPLMARPVGHVATAVDVLVADERKGNKCPCS